MNLSLNFRRNKMSLLTNPKIPRTIYGMTRNSTKNNERFRRNLWPLCEFGELSGKKRICKYNESMRPFVWTSIVTNNSIKLDFAHDFDEVWISRISTESKFLYEDRLSRVFFFIASRQLRKTLLFIYSPYFLNECFFIKIKIVPKDINIRTLLFYFFVLGKSCVTFSMNPPLYSVVFYFIMTQRKTGVNKKRNFSSCRANDGNWTRA